MAIGSSARMGSRELVRKQASEKLSGEPSESEFPLERRGNGDKTNGKSPSSKGRRNAKPIGRDAIVEAIGRLCRRFQRDDKEFCLASLKIPEYAPIARTIGKDVADQLDKIGSHILIKSLRSHDLICFLEPGRYLVVMPLTSKKSAERAVERVAVRIGESKLRQKSNVIRPSTSSRVISVLDLKDADSVEGTAEPLPDTPAISVESLLAALGYKVDQKGQISFRDAETGSSPGKIEPPFCGTFADWKSRYGGISNSIRGTREQFEDSALFEIRRSQIVDRWDAEKNKELRLITPFGLDVPMTTQAAEEVLRRLRTLQSLAHPGLARLTDFYISEDWRLYLVSDPVHGPSLSDKLTEEASSSEEKGDSRIFRWLMQIVNALIAAQSIVPPLVPRSLKDLQLRLVTSSKKNPERLRVVLSDFDLGYVVAPYSAGYLNGGTSRVAAERRSISRILIDLNELFLPHLESRKKNSTSLELELLEIVGSLADPPSELNTLYKLRSRLRSIEHSNI